MKHEEDGLIIVENIFDASSATALANWGGIYDYNLFRTEPADRLVLDYEDEWNGYPQTAVISMPSMKVLETNCRPLSLTECVGKYL